MHSQDTAAQGLFHKLAKQYWWKSMYTYIYHYCHSCLTCASYGGSYHKVHTPLQLLPVRAPFEHVGIDIMEMCLKHVREIAMCVDNYGLPHRMGGSFPHAESK